jgi:signal transduction histidine kinase
VDRREWPYRPIHITDVHAVPCPEEKREQLTGQGVLAHSHVQGIQAAIADAVGFPTTIIEFSPKGAPVRTDSPSLNKLMNPACREFRKHCQWCIHTDEAHAKLFYDNEGYQSAERLQANIDSALAEDTERYRYGDGLKACVRDGRVYLSYRCRTLGYRESVFPIVLEGNLLAVFLVGQIVLDTDKEQIEARMHALGAFRPLETDCLNPPSCTIPPDATSAILQEHCKWVSEPGTVLSETQYSDKIDLICNHLDGFEERQIAESLQLRRYHYVNEKVASIIGNFKSGPSKDIKSPRGPLDDLWAAAQISFESIVADFYYRYIVVFGVNRLSATRVHELNIVVRAGDLPAQFAKDQSASEITLNLEALDHKHSNGALQYGTPSENPEYLSALRSCDLGACGDFELILMPVLLHPQSSIGILVGYRADHPRMARENLRDGELSRSLRAFDALLVSSVSATLAGIAQRIADDQMRILWHESSQLIAGIDWQIERHLKSEYALAELTQERLDDVSSNLSVFVRNLELVYSSTNSIFTETLSFSPREFMAYGAILFKWRDFYRLEARRKNLQIVARLDRPDDEMRPRVWGDEALLEQLLYNLLNNAVKYCYRGTRIYLDCSLLSDEENAPHVLSVVDYGMEMPAGRDLYELYARGTLQEQGQGIGLFLADRIAQRHGGRMRHECRLVSRFNIPLIRPFFSIYKKRLRESWATKDLYVEVEEEIRRIGGELEKILSVDENRNQRNVPLSSVITETELLKPTYEVKVMVELPRKGAGAL